MNFRGALVSRGKSETAQASKVIILKTDRPGPGGGQMRCLTLTSCLLLLFTAGLPAGEAPDQAGEERPPAVMPETGVVPEAPAGETTLPAAPEGAPERPATAAGEPAAVSPPPAELEPVPPEQLEPVPPGMITLNFRDALLDAVLEYLSEAAGLSVVRETPVDGRITLISRRPIPVEAAVDLLNAALRERGYTALLADSTLRVIPLAEARHRNIPVFSGRDPAALAPSDRVITHVIPLRFVNAVQLRRDLEPLLSPHASLTANAASNALIITDNQASIRRLMEVVLALDTAVSVVSEIRVFALEYASAANLATLVNELFREDQAAPATAQERGVDRMARILAARGERTPEAPAADAVARTPRVQALADERTNTLVVSGSPEALAVVAAVVEELDARPEEEQAVFVFSLKNAKAANVQTILSNLFAEMQTTAAQAGRTAAPDARTRRTR